MTKYKMILVTLLSAFLLTACGEDEELTAYQEDMNTFFERAVEYNDKMNAIDRESDTAVIELLGYLDAFAEDIQWMAELEVPEQSPRSLETEFSDEGPDMLDPSFDFEDDPMM